MKSTLTLKASLVLGLLALVFAAFGNGSARAACGEEGGDEIAFQGSGKLLLAACGPKGQQAVLRLDGSGKLDPSFAGDGSLGPWTSNRTAHLAVAPEDKVFVEMALGKGKTLRVVLRRFSANGRLDRSFAGGNATVAKGGVPEDLHVFAQPQGTAVVGYYGEWDGCFGNDCAERTNYLQLLRWSAAGKLIAESSHYTEYWGLNNITMAPNGDILAAGENSEYGTLTFLRTKPNLNTRAARKMGEEFGGGIAEILPGSGTSMLISGRKAGIGRYLTNWSQDESFGENGFVDCGGADDRFLVMRAALPDGGFLAEGDSEQCPLIRYLADGRPDPSFGSGGSIDLAALGLLPPPYRMQSIAVGPEGQFAIAFANANKPIVRISRFTDDGHLETGFGTDGTVTVTGVGSR